MTKTIHLLIKKPAEIDREVREIVLSMFPDFDFSEYTAAFNDVRQLYSGELDGFEKCDTDYHDWGHTLGVLLATIRLMHGMHLDRQEFSERTLRLSLLAALFHDAGYIRRSHEKQGTGAQFTRGHVQRSIDMLEQYANEQGWPMEDVLDMECMIQCTDPAMSPDSIVFINIEIMLAAHGLATADLISQMADDTYLEKLPLLFMEFSEGGITEFPSEYDLFTRTMGFYAFMRTKMETRLSNTVSSLPAHFLARHGVECDFYSEAAVKNMDYLAAILEKHGEEYALGLRRCLDRDGFSADGAA